MNVQERHETQCHIEPGVFIVPLIVMVIYIYMYIYIYIYMTSEAMPVQNLFFLATTLTQG